MNRIATAFGMLLKDPTRAVPLFWRRLFPFGIVPKDPQAYRIGSWSYGSLPRVEVTTAFPGIEAIDVIVPRAYDRVPNVSMDPLESLVLGTLVKFTGARRILEIGTYDGNTTLNLAANSPDDAAIVTVDLPPNWNKNNFESKVTETDLNITDPAVTGAQFKNTAFEGKINQVFGDSTKLDWATLPGPFDLVFIDGCHAYGFVHQDTANALRYCRPGGLIVWHDYGMLKDVSRVVDETARRIKVRALRGTRLAAAFVP